MNINLKNKPKVESQEKKLNQKNELPVESNSVFPQSVFDDYLTQELKKYLSDSIHPTTLNAP